MRSAEQNAAAGSMPEAIPMTLDAAARLQVLGLAFSSCIHLALLPAKWCCTSSSRSFAFNRHSAECIINIFISL